MGCCGSKPLPIDPNFSVDSSQSDLVDSDNAKFKFLLLGAGESGKTTLFKQMKINYAKDYSESSLIDEKERIIRAFLQSFGDFVGAIKGKYGNISDDTELNETVEACFPKKQSILKFNKNLVEVIPKIWNSERGQKVWEQHASHQITDSLEYFCEDFNRISDDYYNPTEEDYLKCRITTAGIEEQTFIYRRVAIYVIDVGGQRAERPKWVNCFDGVNSVLYVAAMSEFDQKLFEDNTVDRYAETKELFGKTLRFLPLRKLPFVLFLNKQDLLIDKLQKLEKRGENLDKYFPSLNLGTDYTNAVDKVQEYMKNELLSVTEEKSRIITHYVTATDKDTFRKVFKAAAQIVLKKAITSHFGM